MTAYFKKEFARSGVTYVWTHVISSRVILLQPLCVLSMYVDISSHVVFYVDTIYAFFLHM